MSSLDRVHAGKMRCLGCIPFWDPASFFILKAAHYRVGSGVHFCTLNFHTALCTNLYHIMLPYLQSLHTNSTAAAQHPAETLHWWQLQAATWEMFAVCLIRVSGETATLALPVRLLKAQTHLKIIPEICIGIQREEIMPWEISTRVRHELCNPMTDAAAIPSDTDCRKGLPKATEADEKWFVTAGHTWGGGVRLEKSCCVKRKWEEIKNYKSEQMASPQKILSTIWK